MATTNHVERPVELELDSEVQRELARHPGKWAAVSRSEVLAIGESIEEVLRVAANKGTETPILLKVPDPDTGASYY